MIKKIDIKYFQSLHDVTYEFTKGLNVIIADNGTGKSVLFKILKLLVNFKKYNEDERYQFITFGRHMSIITFDFFDGISYKVEITVKRMSFFKLNPFGDYDYVGDVLPKELEDCLGLIVCSGGFIGNMLTADKSKLLVDSEDEVNTQVLGLLAVDDNAEKILESIDERVKDVGIAKRTYVAQLTEVNRQLSNYQYVDTTRLKYVYEEISPLVTFIATINPIYELSQSIADVKIPKHDLSELFALAQTCESISESLSTLNIVDNPLKLDELEAISEIDNFMKAIEDKASLIKDLTSIKKPKVDNPFFGLLNRFDSLIDSLKGCKQVKQVDVSLLDSIKEIEHLKDSVSDLADKVYNNEELKKQANSIKKELDSYEGEVYDCPIYGTIKFVDEECIPIDNRPASN